jgi:hypothetical protein
MKIVMLGQIFFLIFLFCGYLNKMCGSYFDTYVL